MTSRLVKREREVDVDEEGEDTFPFNDDDSTNIEDPLAIRTDEDDDLNFGESEVKEEVDDGENGRQLRSHSNENSTKLLKVIIKVKAEPKETKSGSGSRPQRKRKHAMTEEKRKAQNEYLRLRRLKMKAEEREEELQKQRERNRKRRAEMQSEQREETVRKQRERRRRRTAEMTEEKREEFLQKQRERSRKWRARIKEEAQRIKTETTDPGQGISEEDSQPKRKLSQYEEFLQRRREYMKKRKAEDPEKHEKEKRRAREYAKRLREQNPEKNKEYWTKVNERRRMKRLANPATQSQIKKPRKPLTEEQKERAKIRRRLWAQKNQEKVRFDKYSRLQMKIAQMTDEELAQLKAKRREYAKKFYEKLSGEKLEKYRTYWRKNAKKYYEKRLKNNTEQGYAYKDIVNARYRHYVANETPEQRQKRLRRYKINQAITKLRRRLEEIDVPPEEVERRVTDLRKTMEAEPLPPPETLSKYKPRVKSEVNFSLPSRPTQEGRKRGRPAGSSFKTVSISETSCDTQNQTGIVSNEINDSYDFDDQGFLCDLTFDEDANEQVQIDANHGTTTTEPEHAPILRFDIKCPHCPSTYSERSDLINHISTEHSEICWKCPKCKLIVLSTVELSEHFNTTHFRIPGGPTDAITSNETSSKKENTFTCIKCDPVKSPYFENVKNLMAHVESTHPQSFWPCLKCNILKYTELSLKIHEKVCNRTPRKGRERVVKNK